MKESIPIIQETYLSLNLFVRDLNLSKEDYQKYRKGKIITEPSFIEMTYKLGGMSPSLNTRFIILSNKGKDMQALEQDTTWGLYILTTHSYFKILGRFRLKGKQIIVLLHIREEDKDFFKTHEVSMDKNLLNQIKEKLSGLITSPPLKEIDSPLWYKHTNFPIGLKENHTFFKEKEEWTPNQ